MFNHNTIRVILQVHLEKYYKYNFESRDDLDQEALDELNAESTTALETFQALFLNRDQFKNENSANRYIQKASSACDKDILEQLYQWVHESISKSGAQNGIILRSADAPDELANNIARFVKTCPDSVDDEGYSLPSLWPIVEVVRVGLRSPLLERGLIVADLPGKFPTL